MQIFFAFFLHNSKKCSTFARRMRAERGNTMENESYSTLDYEPLPEVSKTRLAEYKGSLGFLITQYGHAIVRRGGLYKQYRERKIKEIWTYIGIGCGIIAAIASVATLIISLLS